ncbi:MAG TPA: hypothetical protein VIC33_09630 [Vicinamibacterales bacterium]
MIYLLNIIHETARSTTAKIRAIRVLLARATELVRAEAPKIYSRELIELTFEQPYCRIANLVQAGIAKRQTASEYLGKLATLGVLIPVQAGREKLFIHQALLRLLSSDSSEAPPYRPAA